MDHRPHAHTAAQVSHPPRHNNDKTNPKARTLMLGTSVMKHDLEAKNSAQRRGPKAELVFECAAAAKVSAAVCRAR
jgi:hypothetical protein